MAKNNEDQKMLGNDILDAIKSGDVKMRPRWFFILRDILGMVAIVIVVLMAVYLASFIIFVLHQNGAWFVPVFGLAGWFALFSALPWMLILLSTAFVILLAIMVKRYTFASQWPLLYSLLGGIFLIAAVCFLFVQSSFYGQFFDSSIARNVPFLGLYYPGYGVLDTNDVHRGTIIAVVGAGASSTITGGFTGLSGFILEDTGGSRSSIIVTTDTNLSFGASLHVGDSVVVFGDRSASGTIFAVGVEKVK